MQKCANIANFGFYCLNYGKTVEDRWVHAARPLTSIEFSFDPCNVYCDGPRGIGYPADAHSVGDSHPSCCDLFQVFKLHMGFPEQKIIFVHLIICLTLQIYDVISARITSSSGTSSRCFCSRRQRLLSGFDSSSWLPAACRAFLYFHGSRWATSICFRFYVILDGR